MKTKAKDLNPVDGDKIGNLDQHHKVLLLLGGLHLPFDNVATKICLLKLFEKFTRFVLQSCVSWGLHGYQLTSTVDVNALFIARLYFVLFDIHCVPLKYFVICIKSKTQWIPAIKKLNFTIQASGFLIFG